MLIGCLCEVVSNVKEIEEEKAMIFDTNENLKTVVDQMKKAGDGDCEMTLEVFREIVLHDEVKKALEDIGVEEKHFECLASILFTNPEKADEFRSLGFGEFVDLLVHLRPEKGGSRMDVADLRFQSRNDLLADRKRARQEFDYISANQENIILLVNDMNRHLDRVQKRVEVLEKGIRDTFESQPHT